MAEGSAVRLVRRVWAELSRDPDELDALDAMPEAPLPARLDVSGLAVGSVAAASLAAQAMTVSDAAAPLSLDGDRIAAAFTSDRAFRWNDERPDVWAPLTGFWRAADAWVRTHANYPQDARALVAAPVRLRHHQRLAGQLGDCLLRAGVARDPLLARALE